MAVRSRVFFLPGLIVAGIIALNGIAPVGRIEAQGGAGSFNRRGSKDSQLR